MRSAVLPVALFSMLAITACELILIDPDAHLVRDVVITSDITEISVGGTAQLTAEVVGDPGAPPEIVWSSSDETIATVNGSGLVRGVARGSAVITAASRANPSIAATVTIEVVVCSAPVEVRGSIDSETWSAQPEDGCTDYLLGNAVTVNGTLTIEPGVRIVAARDAGLLISSSGRLVAVGTADAPIVFTGESEEPGSWRGIKIGSRDVNELVHLEVAFAGGQRWISSDNAEAGIYVRSGRVKLAHSTVRDSKGYGLYVRDASDTLDAFENNRFFANAVPARVTATQVSELDGGTDFNADTERPNAARQVEVASANLSGGPTNEVVWPRLKGDTPYRFSGWTSVAAGVRVEAGALFEFGLDAGIQIQADGYFAAVGTADDPIVFEADNGQPGRWSGLKFMSTSSRNELTHVEIAHGGGRRWLSSDNAEANVYLRGGRLKLTHSLIRDSAAYGVYLRDAEDGFSGFAGNRFTGNLKPLHIRATQVAQLDGATDFSFDGGNNSDWVEVDEATLSGGPTQELLWPRLHGSAEYVFSGTTTVNTGVRIEAGAGFRFTNQAMINVDTNGYLKAVGTSSDPITFYGDVNESGRWGGLRFTSNSSGNELTWTSFGNGAGRRLLSSDGGEGHVLLRGGTLKINSSVFGPVPTNPVTAFAIHCHSGTLTTSALSFEGVAGDRQMSANCTAP